jgi:hypothetical protein
MEGLGTIAVGILLFVVTQYLSRYVFDPIKDFHAVRMKVSYCTLRHQAKITNASDPDGRIATEMRDIAADLFSKAGLIPLYGFVSAIKIFKVPRKEDVLEAARELNGIAANLVLQSQDTNNFDRAVENVQALKKVGVLIDVRTSYS